jgi:hypothetical protein
MIKLRRKIIYDGGWTFIEATLAVVLMAIMVLGLTIVLLAFREHLDRSWAVRVMDQYGNDVIEGLTHDLRNATDVTVRPDTRDTDRITVKFLDDFIKDKFVEHLWYADLRSGQVKVNNNPLDRFYPPRKTRRGESFQILRFQLFSWGDPRKPQQCCDSDFERVDARDRDDKFKAATYKIELTLCYNRGALKVGERSWSFQKQYKNLVYMRNKNLMVQKGITG